MRADGTWFSIKDQCFDDGSTITVITDITERRSAAQRLRQSEERLRDFAGTAADWFWEQDENLRFTYVSSANELASGLAPETYYGKTRREIIHDGAAEAEIAANEALLEQRLPFSDFQWMRPGRDGSMRVISISGVPVFDEDGEFRGYRGTGRDITDRLEVQRRLEESEKRFRDFANSSADWFWEQDENLRFTYISSVNEQFTGTSTETFLGKTRWEATPDGATPEEFADHKATLEAREPFHDFRLTRIGDDGRTHILSLDGVPVHDNEGRFCGYRGTGREITELVVATEERRQMEERFRDFAAASSDFFWETDRQHQFVYFSAEIFASIGVYAGDVIGKSWISIDADGDVAPDYWPDHLDNLDRHQPFRDLRHTVGTRDGKQVWVSASGVPFFDSAGVFLGYRGTTTNISDVVEAERELADATERAVAASKAKSEFLSSMSHELRTPLNAVLGFAQLLDGQVAPRHQRAVDLILSSGDHLLSLINQVLDFSRIESGELQLSVRLLDITDTVEQCLKTVEPMAEDRGITIKSDLRALSDVDVSVDPTRFKQVLLNLLSNAIKYNTDGGEVVCSCKRDTDGMMRFSVLDTGIGIDVAAQGQLFKPFNRLGAEASDIEGVGIGLILSKRMVEAMGGEIGFQSEPELGSTFWFTVAAIASEEGAGSQSDLAEKRGDAPRPAHPNAECVKSILYVEDNPDNRALMEAIVARDKRFRLTAAISAIDGLELAKNLSPDLILLDINLPEMDGYQLLEKLREVPSIKDTPILAVTAAAMRADIEKGKRAGFQAYLTKPLNVGAVLQAIGKFTA